VEQTVDEAMQFKDILSGMLWSWEIIQGQVLDLKTQWSNYSNTYGEDAE
jgi:hypothetical protein